LSRERGFDASAERELVNRPFTISKIEDGATVYFTVRWSALSKADRFDIVRRVPAMSGIFELYYMDQYRKLNIFAVSRSWHGGLRSSLRFMSDPDLDRDPRRKKILEERDVYYRYSLSDSSGDLDDVLYFYMATYFPMNPSVEPSRRYDTIYVKEDDRDRIVTA
jgi:hypothetical protein